MGTSPNVEAANQRRLSFRVGQLRASNIIPSGDLPGLSAPPDRPRFSPNPQIAPQKCTLEPLSCSNHPIARGHERRAPDTPALVRLQCSAHIKIPVHPQAGARGPASAVSGPIQEGQTERVIRGPRGFSSQGSTQNLRLALYGFPGSA